VPIPRDAPNTEYLTHALPRAPAIAPAPAPFVIIGAAADDDLTDARNEPVRQKTKRIRRTLPAVTDIAEPVAPPLMKTHISVAMVILSAPREIRSTIKNDEIGAADQLPVVKTMLSVLWPEQTHEYVFQKPACEWLLRSLLPLDDATRARMLVFDAPYAQAALDTFPTLPAADASADAIGAWADAQANAVAGDTVANTSDFAEVADIGAMGINDMAAMRWHACDVWDKIRLRRFIERVDPSAHKMAIYTSPIYPEDDNPMVKALIELYRTGTGATPVAVVNDRLSAGQTIKMAIYPREDARLEWIRLSRACRGREAMTAGSALYDVARGYPLEAIVPGEFSLHALTRHSMFVRRMTMRIYHMLKPLVTRRAVDSGADQLDDMFNELMSSGQSVCIELAQLIQGGAAIAAMPVADLTRDTHRRVNVIMNVSLNKDVEVEMGAAKHVLARGEMLAFDETTGEYDISLDADAVCLVTRMHIVPFFDSVGKHTDIMSLEEIQSLYDPLPPATALHGRDETEFALISGALRGFAPARDQSVKNTWIYSGGGYVQVPLNMTKRSNGTVAPRARVSEVSIVLPPQMTMSYMWLGAGGVEIKSEGVITARTYKDDVERKALIDKLYDQRVILELPLDGTVPSKGIRRYDDLERSIYSYSFDL
jgi:hypothetical protein